LQSPIFETLQVCKSQCLLHIVQYVGVPGLGHIFTIQTSLARTTTMKRKRRDTMRDNSDVPSPSSKRRRRYSNIEDGFAYLSLNGNSAPYHHAPNSISVEEIPAPVAMDTEMSGPSSYPSQPAYTVEEPTIPEINMKTSSWFEPERDRTLSLGALCHIS
jgi:hypothetical protein